MLGPNPRSRSITIHHHIPVSYTHLDVYKRQQRELVNIRKEVEMIRSRPFSVSSVQPTENREVINFKNYKKNPMGFLERIEGNISRHRETRCSSIRSMLDEHFKDINDNLSLIHI